jgi:DNA-binding transcriptional MerR regulator
VQLSSSRSHSAKGANGEARALPPTSLPSSLPISLTVAAVARRLGVAPATLRTWARRYGLGPSAHTQGEHRRYNSLDLARLTLMRKLIIAGMPPADAAQAALDLKANDYSQGVITELLPREFEGREFEAREFKVREELVDSLMRASESLDRPFIEKLLIDEIHNSGVVATWSEVIVPTLILIGDEWALKGTGIEIEHMFSEIIKNILQQEVMKAFQPKNARPVLLACLGEETHSLPLFALQASLSQVEVATQFLGARTPISAISATVKRSAPPAIFLWAQLAVNADLTCLDQIPSVRPAPRIILGGPGWVRDEVEAKIASNGKIKIVHVSDLPEAIAQVLQSVGS